MTLISTREPLAVTAGESWWWDRILPSYPAADGWALSYTLTGPAPSPLSIPATVSGGVYQVRVPAATTADLPGGTYTLVGQVTKGDDVFGVHRGPLTVRAAATAGTGTLHIEAMVAALRDAELQLATQPRASVTVNGRSIEYRSLEEVRKALAYYETRLSILQTGIRSGPSFAVQFRRPS